MIEQLDESERASALDTLGEWDYDDGRDAITRGASRRMTMTLQRSRAFAVNRNRRYATIWDRSNSTRGATGRIYACHARPSAAQRRG